MYLMYLLKRIAASLLDYAIMLIPAALGIMKLGNPLAQQVVHSGFGFYGRGLLIGSLIAPAIILGVMTGLTGWTPGKLIFSLRVQGYDGDPPGVANGIVRELAKIFLFATVYGLYYAVASVMRDKDAFYDTWLSVEVEDLRPYGMTETQKNYRKFMREKERRERQGLR